MIHSRDSGFASSTGVPLAADPPALSHQHGLRSLLNEVARTLQSINSRGIITRPFYKNTAFGRTLASLALATGALASLAFWNLFQARKAERHNPPFGQFIEVGGVRLHYVEKVPVAPLCSSTGTRSRYKMSSAAGYSTDWLNGIASLLSIAPGSAIAHGRAIAFGHHKRRPGFFMRRSSY